MAVHAASPLQRELDELLDGVDWWSPLLGAHVFLTGGTGFVGSWLLESALWADARFGLGLRVTVLTRDPEAFAARAPHLARSAAVTLFRGDITSFERPAGTFTHVIHAATETNTDLSHPDALTLFSASADGTRRLLEFCRAAAVSPVLFVSSGAVYGAQPLDLSHVDESYPGAPSTTDVGSGYGHGKRTSEFLCTAYGQRYGIQPKIARCFAFVGPYLPLSSGFAIGNFIADALEGRDITLSGDGSPLRSYMYAADLARWLWTILLNAPPGRAYNVGSDDSRSILEVARTVAGVLAPEAAVHIGRTAPSGPPPRYVPCIRRARDELGLDLRVDLADGIRRTAAWHRARTHTD